MDNKKSKVIDYNPTWPDGKLRFEVAIASIIINFYYNLISLSEIHPNFNH